MCIFYYPGQKNRYSREIHEADLQFDHVKSCDIKLRFDIDATRGFCASRAGVADRSRCRMISDDRTEDQSHEYLGCNDFFGQGSIQLVQIIFLYYYYCRRRASSLWTPLALASCGRRRVVGDVPLCFCGAELSAEGNSSFPRRCGGWPTRRASSLSFSVVRPSPSSFRGSLRLGELGVTVLCRVEYSCRVVAGLVILRRSGHSSAPFLL